MRTQDVIVCAHGTADPRGSRTVHELVRQLARRRPDLRLSLGFLDVDAPALPELVGRVVADAGRAVVVPLLLSTGYHLRVDVAAVCGDAVTAAGALGPDELLVDVLADRLAQRLDGPLAGRHRVGAPVDRVVLAAAGSTDPQAYRDCEATAALLADRIGRPVDVGYVSGSQARLTDVVGDQVLRGRVAVATYLLAPGRFADLARRVATSYGTLCSDPLGADPRVAEVALARYDAVAPAAVTAPSPAGWFPS